jgi:hypothetical protein
MVSTRKSMNEEAIHPAALPLDRLAAECSMRTTRRSGPGGQHRNKVETAVILTHQPTGIRAEANERRSQGENREVALRRLRLRLAVEVRATPREPSPLWNSRLKGSRLQVSPEHNDFPALLAEILDHWHDSDGELGPIAETFRTTSSQLVKLLQLEPKAMELVNRHRQEQGKRPLQ